MPKRNNLTALLEHSGEVNRHKPKVSRAHLATEVAERSGSDKAGELCRHLFPRLQQRVLHPQPRRK